MNRTLAFVLGFLSASLLAVLWFALRDTASHSIVLTAPETLAEKATRWKLTNDPDTGRPSLNRDGLGVSPVWTLEPGWFVWVENDERAWWYNGKDGIVLLAYESPGRVVSYSAYKTPVPPPDGFIERIGRLKYQKIAEASAESMRRLGIVP